MVIRLLSEPLNDHIFDSVFPFSVVNKFYIRVVRVRCSFFVESSYDQLVNVLNIGILHLKLMPEYLYCFLSKY